MYWIIICCFISSIQLVYAVDVNCSCNINSTECYIFDVTVNLINPCPSNLTALVISGNMSVLANNQLPSFPNIQELTVTHLILYEAFLQKFPLLTTLTIRECSYNASSQFLQSSVNSNIKSLTMENNNLIDGTLPNNPFQIFQQLVSLTIIEPQLNTTSLGTNVDRNLDSLTLELGSYQNFDLNSWTNPRQYLSRFEIRNLITLSVFPSEFFSKFPKLNYLILSGNFILKTEDICAFYHYPSQKVYNRLPITLEQTTGPNDQCAKNYIDAINRYDCTAPLP
ncbi:unnamed protein product, partial [Didymodactylos carnosus]